MRSGAAMRMVTGALCVVFVIGCTASSDDDAGTEVAGAVLERDDDAAASSEEDLDDERSDPRVDDEDEADPPASEPDPEPEPPNDDEQDTSAESDGSDEATGTETDASTGTGADSAQSSGGDATSPPPDQPVRPTPQGLSAGAGLPGDVVGFGADGAEVLVGGPLDAVPPVGVRSDALRVGDGNEVRCETALQAPQERGLLARGELSVGLRIEGHDGSERRIALQVMDLDVELEAGERFALPSSRARAFDRDEVASISCEASFAPA